MAGRRYMFMLTAVRPLMPDDPPRDERMWPEDKRAVMEPADYEAAQRMFAAFCALLQIKAGRQRAKGVPLAGGDTHRPTGRYRW